MEFKQALRLAALGVLLLGGFVFAGGSPAVCAQVQQRSLSARIKNFRVPDYYEAKSGEAARLKWLIAGAEAQPLPGSQIRIQGLRFEYYTKEGATNIAIEAAQGVFDQATQSAFSPGELKVILGDGQVDLQGTGFYWQPSKTNSILVISNRIQTVLHQRQEIHLQADRFEYDTASKRAAYRDHVEGQDTNMILTCEFLTLDVPETGDELHHIVAETNVVVVGKQDQSRATGQRAEYIRREGRDLIELTGQPTWRLGSREGRADRLRFDRDSRTFSAVGHAYMKLPKTDMAASASLLPSFGPRTNALAEASEFVGVYADEFHTLADGALFQENVRLEDQAANGPGNQSRCGRLRLKTNADGQLESVAMEENVLLAQGDAIQITGQKLIYLKQTDTAELTGQPAWRMEGREGSAERLVFDLRARSVLAQGQARLKLPRDKASQPLWALDSSSSETQAAADAYLEARADRYSAQARQVRFEEKIVVQEWRNGATNSQLTCGLLTVNLTDSNQVEKIIAERNVVLEQGTPASQGLTCQKLELTTQAGRVDSVVATGDVVFQQADRKVTGSRMVYQTGNDVLEGTGSPVVVESAEGRMVSDRVRLERQANRRIARGNIYIRVDMEKARASGGANFLRVPIPTRAPGK